MPMCRTIAQWQQALAVRLTTVGVTRLFVRLLLGMCNRRVFFLRNTSSLAVMHLLQPLWAHALKHKCHSCFHSCPYVTGANGTRSRECDCTGAVCHGEHCYTHVELWPEEELMLIQVLSITTRIVDNDFIYYRRAVVTSCLAVKRVATMLAARR